MNNDQFFAKGRVISNLALAHFKAAKHFASEVSTIETTHAGQDFGPFFEQIRMYCVSSIISSAASIECLINELFISPGPLHEAISDFETFFWGGIEVRKRFLLFPYERQTKGLERTPTLQKYKKAVALQGNRV